MLSCFSVCLFEVGLEAVRKVTESWQVGRERKEKGKGRKRKGRAGRRKEKQASFFFKIKNMYLL